MEIKNKMLVVIICFIVLIMAIAGFSTLTNNRLIADEIDTINNKTENAEILDDEVELNTTSSSTL